MHLNILIVKLTRVVFLLFKFLERTTVFGSQKERRQTGYLSLISLYGHISKHEYYIFLILFEQLKLLSLLTHDIYFIHFIYYNFTVCSKNKKVIKSYKNKNYRHN